MSTLARHKKPEGFRKLILFLEDTAEDKRKKILDFMREEDKRFVATVEKYIFHFDEFEKMNDMIVCEIVSELKDMSTLAMALFKCPNENLVKKFTSNIPPDKQIKYKQEHEYLEKVTTGQQQSSRMKIIMAARQLEDARKIQLKYCPKTYAEDLT